MVNKSYKAHTTQVILQNTKSSLLHLLPDPTGYFVSSVSRWEDVFWQYDVPSAIRRAAGVIRWDFELPDGTRFTDPQHATLLNSFKRMEWARLADSREGKAGKTSGAADAGTPIRRLVRWMVLRSHQNFSTLNADAFDEFADDLITQLQEAGLEPDIDFLEINEADASAHEYAENNEDIETLKISDEEQSFWSALIKAFNLWKRIWLHSNTMWETGTPSMLVDPLRGRTPNSIASELTERTTKEIPPLPDDVAIPIMNTAHLWLGARANDVIRLHNHYMQVLPSIKIEQDKDFIIVHEKEAQLLGTFTFSLEAGSKLPWHSPIGPVPREYQQKNYTLPTKEIRTLVNRVIGACLIVIQSESGMRVSELASLPAGRAPNGGEHNAINIRQTESGLNELFFIRAVLNKTVDSPKEEEWLGACRPIGSTYVPGPYRAIQVLEELLGPWRVLADDPNISESLLIHTTVAQSLPYQGGNFGKSTLQHILRHQRGFIEECVDLSGLPDKSRLGEDLIPYRESKGCCLKTHQWRKTFAMYVVRTDPRMLPAIATQFKHLSIAMTEKHYVSNNPMLLRERDSQQARAAAALMFTRVTGKAPIAGRVAKLIDEYALEIQTVIDKKDGVEALNRLQNWCAQGRIKLFSAPHGKCMIGLKPVEAKCHEAAGTTHWSRDKPNFEKREPDVCAGCRCFGVDSDHADFWVNRYIENQTAWQQAKDRGLTSGFRVIQERAGQSANMLRVLEIPLPDIRNAGHAQKTT